MKRLWLWLLLGMLGFSLLFHGCGGSSAPSVPTEIPSPVVLKFVEADDLQIDYSTISSAATATSISKVVDPGGELSQEIASGPEFKRLNEEQFLVPALKGLGEIDIPADVETYEEVVTFSTDTGFLAGTHEVKLDFRLTSIDIDGDGVAESCSGNSGEAPACILFWLGGAPYSVWRIEEGVDEEAGTIGKGFFKLFIEDLDGFETALAIRYEQTGEAPADKAVDLKLRATNNYTADFTGWSGIIADIQQFLWHYASVQEAVADDPTLLFKDLNLNGHLDMFDVDTAEKGFIDSRYIGRFVDGFEDALGLNYWSGSLFNAGQEPGDVFQTRYDELDICALLPSGDRADDPAACEDVAGVNLRTGNTDFVDAAVDADFARPPELTDTPTF